MKYIQRYTTQFHHPIQRAAFRKAAQAPPGKPYPEPQPDPEPTIPVPPPDTITTDDSSNVDVDDEGNHPHGGRWKEELASDSEAIVKAERQATGKEEDFTLLQIESHKIIHKRSASQK